MRNIFLTTVLFISTITLHAQTAIEGFWVTVDKNNTVIEVLKQNKKYQGVRRSTANKSYKIGELILKEITQKGNKWKGKIYAPSRKKWYDVELTPVNDLLKLKIKVSIFSKTITWKRYQKPKQH